MNKKNNLTLSIVIGFVFMPILLFTAMTKLAINNNIIIQLATAKSNPTQIITSINRSLKNKDGVGETQSAKPTTGSIEFIPKSIINSNISNVLNCDKGRCTCDTKYDCN